MRQRPQASGGGREERPAILDPESPPPPRVQCKRTPCSTDPGSQASARGHGKSRARPPLSPLARGIQIQPQIIASARVQPAPREHPGPLECSVRPATFWRSSYIWPQPNIMVVSFSPFICSNVLQPRVDAALLSPSVSLVRSSLWTQSSRSTLLAKTSTSRHTEPKRLLEVRVFVQATASRKRSNPIQTPSHPTPDCCAG